MLTFTSVASTMAVVLGYRSLNAAGIVSAMVSRSGQIGSMPRPRYIKLIHVINTRETDDGEISKCLAKSCFKFSLNRTSVKNSSLTWLSLGGRPVVPVSLQEALAGSELCLVAQF